MTDVGHHLYNIGRWNPKKKNRPANNGNSKPPTSTEENAAGGSNTRFEALADEKYNNIEAAHAPPPGFANYKKKGNHFNSTTKEKNNNPSSHIRQDKLNAGVTSKFNVYDYNIPLAKNKKKEKKNVRKSKSKIVEVPENEMGKLNISENSLPIKDKGNEIKPVNKKLLRKQEEEIRLVAWKNYFRVERVLMLILDVHQIHLLRTIQRKCPKANFICAICQYCCDNLEIVDNHIHSKCHQQKLKHALLASTATQIPFPPKSIEIKLTAMLQNVCTKHLMSSSDVLGRAKFVSHLNTVIAENLPGCSLRIFGSSLHGMGFRNADLNLDLVVPPNMTGPTALTKLGDLLTNVNECRNLTKHFSAEIPFLSFDFELDTLCLEAIISLNNGKPVQLSQLLLKYSTMDPRVLKICGLFRFWGNMCGIDRQAEGTWPSYSFYLLAIYFLQQVHTPVLPVLHEFAAKKGNEQNYADPKDITDKWFCKNVDSLGNLWLQLFRFYTVDFDTANRLVNIQQFAPCLRKQKMWGGKRIAVVDPFLPKRNVTRSVSHDDSYEFIIYCLYTSYLYFAIPQTSQGPIFGTIRHDTSIDDLDIPEVWELHQVQKNMASSLTRLLPLLDSNYTITDRNQVNIDEILSFLNEGKFVNLFNFDLSFLNFGKIEQRKPFNNKYKDLAIYKADAMYLMISVDPRFVEFSFEKRFFTDGKKAPLSCSLCQREGHGKMNCPEENLPPLEDLPSLDAVCLSRLDFTCEFIYDQCAPSEMEIQTRYNVVEELEDYISSLYPGARLTLFGSSCNGFGLKGSDLDICLTFQHNSTGEGLDPPNFIENLCTDLKRYPGLQKLVCIPSAKVPIIKFLHKPTLLEGDISLYNTLALENTKLLLTYSKIDRRVKVLGYIIKKFAKLCKIGDASKGSLSSYSYTLMVIYFLQQCYPPVLPVLQELSDDTSGGVFPIQLLDGHNIYFYNNLDNLSKVWPHFGKNSKSVGELWIELLKFYTEKFDFVNQVISIRCFKPVSKFSKLWGSKCIAIEDPFDLNHNLGSALSRKMNIYIIKAFRKGRLHFSVPALNTQESNLVRYYFDPKILADVEPPNDRGCHICKTIGHRSQLCPERRGKVPRKLQGARGNL